MRKHELQRAPHFYDPDSMISSVRMTGSGIAGGRCLALSGSNFDASRERSRSGVKGSTDQPEKFARPAQEGMICGEGESRVTRLEALDISICMRTHSSTAWNPGVKGICIALIIFGLSCCVHVPDSEIGVNERRWHAMNKSFVLTHEQILQLKKEANNGSIEACERLTAYYVLVRMDDKTAALWQIKAGRFGSPTGYANAEAFLDDDDCED